MLEGRAQLRSTLALCAVAALLASASSTSRAASTPVGEWRDETTRTEIGTTQIKVYRTPKFALVLDELTGEPKYLTVDGNQVVHFGKGGWWQATFEDGSTVDAADAQSSVAQSGNDLVCQFTSDKIKVQLRITGAGDHVDLRAHVSTLAGVITRFALPESVLFDPNSVNEVDYPEELGRGLKPSFFQPQAGGFSHWSMKSLGAQGAADVGVLPVQMLDYDGSAVPATVTDQGKVWLGDSGDLTGWNVRCPRPPMGTPSATLIDTPNGPLLSMESVDGGWGWFIRWGGLFGGQDQRKVLDTTKRLLTRLWSIDAPGGFKIHPPLESRDRPLKDSLPNTIGIVSLNHDPNAVRRWRDLARDGGWNVKLLSSPDDVKASTKAHDCWAIVNVDQEVLPSTLDGEKAAAAAIRDYISHGGIWVHTGAAPFYYTVEEQPYQSVESSYPPLFSDFLHIDSKAGQVSVYGIQKPADPIVPAHLDAGGGDLGGYVGRGWVTWIDKGQGWTSPVARIAVGLPVDASVRAYGVANGFTTPLASKVTPAVLAKMKQSLLINYAAATYKDEAAGIAKLPSPCLVHVWDYLHGGFDKQLPDHLPPNPIHGTPEDFGSVVKATHAAGDLFMPYTNPTWWCDDPQGPTFIKNGTAPLLVDRKGNNVKEVYAANWGWALCAFHPAARAAEASILKSFTTDYPSDVLFQDQIGARGTVYDFNPAAPNPNSYTEGMREIALRDSKVVPLSTENGFDGVMNPETQFCGVCWGLIPTQYGPDWNRLWRDRFAPGTWTTRPLALWLAHDKVVFTMHDLGQFVTNREVLSWTTVLGYELSMRTSVEEMNSHPNDPWLAWLAALQKTFGPGIVGQPLTSWEELKPGVFRARYGQTVVTSNTTDKPVDIDARLSLPAFGFVIMDPSTRSGGSVTKFDGKAYPSGLDFIDVGRKLSTFKLDR